MGVLFIYKMQSSPCDNGRLSDLLARTTSITRDNNRLSDLFAQATSMMRNLGIEPPPGMNPPTEAEISTVFSNMLGNESTSTAVMNVLDSVQGPESESTSTPHTSAVIMDLLNSLQGSDIETIFPPLVQTTPVASIDPASALKLLYVRSGDILVGTNDENLSLLCEGPKLQLKCNDVVQIIGLGNFEVLSVGSGSEKWVLRELIITS